MLLNFVFPILLSLFSEMDFQKLHENIDCDCINGATQNCTEYFARRVGLKDKGVKDRYFRVQEHLYEDVSSDCKHSCGNRALSISLWNDESESYLTTKMIRAAIVPGFRKNLVIFKIKQTGGLVKPTPTDDDIFHYDYYQPDEFSVDTCIDYIKTVEIAYVI